MNAFLKHILLLLHMLALSGIACSQSTDRMMFHQIREADGLSYNIINSMFQDSRGFLWIASYNGLNRYDGSHFMVYKNNRHDPHSLVSNVVHSVCEDHQGRIWCSTDDGISCYDLRTNLFTSFTSWGGEAFNFSYNIVCDRNGVLWFTGRKGLFKIDPATFTITHYASSADPDSPTSHFYHKNGLVLDPVLNVLWCGTGSGLMRVDCDNGSFTSHKNAGTSAGEFPPGSAAALCLSTDGQLYWADLEARRIFFSALNTPIAPHEVVLTEAEKDRLFDVSTLFCDSRHRLWISSWNYELMGIDLDSGKRIPLTHDVADPRSIGAQFFWDVWQSADGALWFGTVNGISICNPENQFYTIMDFKDHVGTEIIRSMAKMKDGTICIGLGDGRIVLRDPSGHTDILMLPKAVASPKEYRPVVGFKEMGSRCLVHTQQGIWDLDMHTHRLDPLVIPGITNRDDVHMAYITAQGDSVLWIPCQPVGVLRYELATGHSVLYQASSDAEDFHDVFTLAIDSSGVVYATDRYPHLFRLAKGAPQFEAVPLDTAILAELKTEIITDLDIAQGKVHLTHKGAGLVIYDPKTDVCQHLDESDGMLFNAAMAAATDPQSRLWIAAYNKISVLLTDGSFTSFSLPVQEIAYRYINTAVTCADGNILLGFDHELVEIIPERFDRKQEIPAPLVSALHCADTTFMLIGENRILDLAVEQNYFTIDFAQLYAHYDQVEYFYKLEGLHDSWVKAGRQTAAYFTNLPGGDYNFLVKAVLNNVESPVSELQIHIATVFYKTWWFITFCVVLILFITFLVLRNRQQHRNLVHELAINNERLQREKATVQYDNLTNQLNPHFLFNSLSSLDSLIQDNKTLASSFLQHLSKVYRYVLQNKERETVSLQTELAFIANYVFLLETRFQQGFVLKYDVRPEDLEQELVPVTLQILVENAVKHNTITLSKPLLVEITTDGEYVIVTNTLRRKSNVETSNKQGMEKLRTLYKYLTDKPIVVEETDTHYTVKIPLV